MYHLIIFLFRYFFIGKPQKRTFVFWVNNGDVPSEFRDHVSVLEEKWIISKIDTLQMKDCLVFIIFCQERF